MVIIIRDELQFSSVVLSLKIPDPTLFLNPSLFSTFYCHLRHFSPRQVECLNDATNHFWIILCLLYLYHITLWYNKKHIRWKVIGSNLGLTPSQNYGSNCCYVRVEVLPWSETCSVGISIQKSCNQRVGIFKQRLTI